MIHDEKTTEIEIPKKTVTQFRRRASDRQAPNAERSAPPAATPAPSIGASSSAATVESVPLRALPWLKRLDLTNPWLIRLVAVLIIVGLSLLVI